MPSARERWFAEVLHAGLQTRLMTEQDVLAHATPAVLIASLPRDVLVRIFDGALSAGAMSPRGIVETATAEVLAEKVAPNLIWGCVTQVVERSGIKTGKPADEIGAREFLRRTLSSALSTGVVTPADVVHHVDAKILGTAFPDALTTKLLEVTLAAGKINPEIVVETLGVEAIAKHAPVDILWGTFIKPGEAQTPGMTVTIPAPAPGAAKKPGRTLEVIEDDVASVLVDLDDAFEKETKHRSSTQKPH